MHNMTSLKRLRAEPCWPSVLALANSKARKAVFLFPIILTHGFWLPWVLNAQISLSLTIVEGWPVLERICVVCWFRVVVRWWTVGEDGTRTDFLATVAADSPI